MFLSAFLFLQNLGGQLPIPTNLPGSGSPDTISSASKVRLIWTRLSELGVLEFNFQLQLQPRTERLYILVFHQKSCYVIIGFVMTICSNVWMFPGKLPVSSICETHLGLSLWFPWWLTELVFDHSVHCWTCRFILMYAPASSGKFV